MKTVQQRNKENKIGGSMIILFVLLIVGTFGDLVGAVNQFENILLERAVMIPVVMAVLLVVHQYATSSFS